MWNSSSGGSQAAEEQPCASDFSIRKQHVLQLPGLPSALLINDHNLLQRRGPCIQLNVQLINPPSDYVRRLSCSERTAAVGDNAARGAALTTT